MIEPLEKNINCKVPVIFSLKNNTEETIKYFADVKAHCISKEKVIINFDLYDLKTVTIDAIMYMIAMTLQASAIRSDITFRVCKPRNKKMRSFINNCGLKKFLEKDNEPCDNQNDYYVIKIGVQTDTDIAEEISNFTKSKNDNLDVKQMSMLYKMLIEMMNNSLEHAYDIKELGIIKSKLVGLWFVFIENSGDRLKFTFLDTGIGIPNSLFMKKEGSYEDLEIMFGKRNLKQEDPKRSYIVQALSGNVKRANSLNSNRGQGLPEIYGYYKNEEIFSNLCIISGNEKCRFYDSDKSRAVFDKLDYELHGTLYYWEVKKG
ncbi:MAG: hypothetical protein HFF01_00810 [Erysipelotrichaceae bacterium]|nr:hypothetical protein [Erysipelotrichaceae bacterium]